MVILFLRMCLHVNIRNLADEGMYNFTSLKTLQDEASQHIHTSLFLH